MNTHIQNIVKVISTSFWETMAHIDGDSTNLSIILSQLNAHDISMFHYEYETLITILQSTIMDMLGLHSDEAKELAGWIVSQGRAYFEQIIHHPAAILELKGIVFDPRLINVAHEVYFSKFNDFIPVPETGYWYYMASPFAADPDYRNSGMDLMEDICFHNEFIDRFETPILPLRVDENLS